MEKIWRYELDANPRNNTELHILVDKFMAEVEVKTSLAAKKKAGNLQRKQSGRGSGRSRSGSLLSPPGSMRRSDSDAMSDSGLSRTDSDDGLGASSAASPSSPGIFGLAFLPASSCYTLPAASNCFSVLHPTSISDEEHYERILEQDGLTESDMQYLSRDAAVNVNKGASILITFFWVFTVMVAYQCQISLLYPMTKYGFFSLL